MISTFFDRYSHIIQEEYTKYLDSYMRKQDTWFVPLYNSYRSYTCLDHYFPRPLLTFLAINAYQNDLPQSDEIKRLRLVFIPQLIRDFLAIHDDVIDEDIVKLNGRTIPFSFSRFGNHTKSDEMTKQGKDLAILFADFLIQLPYEIISNLDIEPARKIDLCKAISKVIATTNLGQLQELMMSDLSFADISENSVLSLYRSKAADYCFAFPTTLGLIYSGVEDEIVNKTRELMLNIGAYSQIVNDIEGVWPEFFSNERDTLSDLLYLRRSYLLWLLWSRNINNEFVASCLEKDSLSREEALSIKDIMVKSDLLSYLRVELEIKAYSFWGEIDELCFGPVFTNYLKSIVESRIIIPVSKLPQ